MSLLEPKLRNHRSKSIALTVIVRLTMLSPFTGRKMAFAALGTLAMTTPAAFGNIRMIPMHSQILHPSEPLPSFEVATIKPSGSDEDRFVEMGLDHYTAKHLSARQLVKYAYHIQLDDQLAGGPSWIDREYFDIEAKLPEAEVKTIAKLDFWARFDRFGLMLQSMLQERFQLTVDSETRELPAYALRRGEGRLKLKQVEVSPGIASSLRPPPPLPPPPPPPPNGASASPAREAPLGALPMIRWTGPHQFTATAYRMGWLPQWLFNHGELAGRPVVDQTGLTGNYDFVLKDISMATPVTPPDDSTTSIFTALEEQLGLKLVPIKAPTEVIRISHIERPSEN